MAALCMYSAECGLDTKMRIHNYEVQIISLGGTTENFYGVEIPAEVALGRILVVGLHNHRFMFL